MNNLMNEMAALAVLAMATVVAGTARAEEPAMSEGETESVARDKAVEGQCKRPDAPKLRLTTSASLNSAVEDLWAIEDDIADRNIRGSLQAGVVMSYLHSTTTRQDRFVAGPAIAFQWRLMPSLPQHVATRIRQQLARLRDYSFGGIEKSMQDELTRVSEKKAALTKKLSEAKAYLAKLEQPQQPTHAVPVESGGAQDAATPGDEPAAAPKQAPIQVEDRSWAKGLIAQLEKEVVLLDSETAEICATYWAADSWQAKARAVLEEDVKSLGLVPAVEAVFGGAFDIVTDDATIPGSGIVGGAGISIAIGSVAWSAGVLLHEEGYVGPYLRVGMPLVQTGGL